VITGSRRLLVDGVIFSPLAVSPDDVTRARVAVPLVLLHERVPDGAFDSVCMPNEAGAAAAVEHLMAAGCTAIAAIGLHPSEATGTSAERTVGFRLAHQRAGRRVDERLVIRAYPWDRREGAAGVRILLERGVRFDGLFCFNDRLALGALHALLDAGVRVPEDVKVIGFDDTDDARYATPSLSSVSPGREQIAKHAVGLLRRRLAKGGEHAPAVDAVTEHHVVGRRSTEVGGR
jgi:DNA-binding LacI/PurR family transcriptional regulator